MAIFQLRRDCMSNVFAIVVFILLTGGGALSPDGEALMGFRASVPRSDGILQQWRPEEEDPCSWKGVTCNMKSRRVIHLNLSHHKMNGIIPPDIGKLDCLEILELNNNIFYGKIPSELGNCTKLREIYLQGNYLGEEIPSELGNLTGLQVLDISSNALSGSIPPALGQLNNLIALNLSSNFLVGSIPSDGVFVKFVQDS